MPERYLDLKEKKNLHIQSFVLFWQNSPMKELMCFKHPTNGTVNYIFSFGTL